MLLLGEPAAQVIRSRVKKSTQDFIATFHQPPKLVVLLIGKNPASLLYCKKKKETAIALGLHCEIMELDEKIPSQKVKASIASLNTDPSVHGILIQRPLPAHFNDQEVVYWICPEKDVDVFHPENTGRFFLGLPGLLPATASGIMALLHYYQIPIAGKIACVVGRSSIVGKPIASLLLQAHATVLQCHSQTLHLAQLTSLADILIVAIGKKQAIQASFIKPGATVIDVGIHQSPDGKLKGDVDYDAVIHKASAITPVPGGVGPMTIAALMENTIFAAKKTIAPHEKLSLQNL